MYKKPRFERTTIDKNEALEGETIEQKIERVVHNGEPITDGAPIIHTEKADGVKAGYNIRTDRFEVALDAMDKVQRSLTAKRDESTKEKEVTGGETAQGTETE